MFLKSTGKPYLYVSGVLYILMIIQGALSISIKSRDRPNHVVERHVEKICAAHNLTYFESENATQTWCCECPPGFFMEKECVNTNEPLSKCKPCEFNKERQTFTDRDNHAKVCNQSRISCDDLMNTELKLGSREADNTCECKIGFYRDTTLGFCKPHTQCIVGFGILELGNKASDSVCVRCSGNMFSDKVSSTEGCRPHSECKTGQRQVFPGNTMTDVQCVDVGTPHDSTVILKDETTSGETTTSIEATSASPGTEIPLYQPRWDWVIACLFLVASYCFGKFHVFGIIWEKIKQTRGRGRSEQTQTKNIRQDGVKDEEPLITENRTM